MVKYMASSKKKPQYKEGTINGERTNQTRRLTRKEKEALEYKSLVKMLTSCVCVLIMVFVLNWIITSSFTFNGIFYEEPSGNEVIEVISSSVEGEPDELVTLYLDGKLTVIVEQGKKYKEPGYKATSNVYGDISDYVVVTGKVDTSTIGTYEITYTLSYKGINPKLTRLIKVVEKKKESKPEKEEKPGNNDDKDNPSTPTEPSQPAQPVQPSQPSQPSQPVQPQQPVQPSQPVQPVKPQGNITLKLNGEATVYLNEGSTYKDAFATAIDNNGNDVSSQIVVNGSVNTSVAGTYKITYSIKNYNGEELTVVRNVIVQAMGISLKLDNSNPTNKSVNILVSTNVDNFDRLMLPNGTKVPNKSYSYKVTTNGTYEFIVFNTSGGSRKATIVVNNIDKDKPKGKCEITHGENGSYITITASDVSGISKYIYSGKEYTDSVITIGHRLATGIQINIGFYDKAGNFGNTNCLSP